MVTRISGLASGMDIDQMVSQLMKAHRIPLDKLKQKKQLLEWQRDDYRAMNSKILELRNTAFTMKLQSTYLTKKATSSNDSIVTVSANPGANAGNYSIKILNLAQSASVTSGDVVSGAGSNQATLGSLGLPADTTLTIGGEKGTATIQVKTTDTIDGLVRAVNGKSGVTGVSLSYDATLDRFFFVSTSTGANAKVDLKMQSTSEGSNQNLLYDVLKLSSAVMAADSGQTVTGTNAFSSGTSSVIDSTLTAAQTLRISYDGKNYDFSITKSTTIGNLMDAINSSDLGKAGVSAYLDSNGKLAFFNPDDTKTLAISDITADGTDIVAKLGLTAPVTVSNIDYSKIIANGKNAEIEFNNVPGSFASNTFTINGITFTAKSKQAATDTPVNVSVAQDTDAVYNAIKSFVDKYNEVIDAVNKEIAEKRYRDFQPLTDEQKKDMKDDEIKLWEEKARSGMLRNDGILSSALYKFRNSLAQSVSGLPNGDLKQMAEIGITTGSYEENGKLYINESKLRQALADHPEQVMRLFTATDGDDTKEDGDGLAFRLYEQTDRVLNQLKEKAGTVFSVEDDYFIGERIKEVNEQIDRLSDRLTDLENRYYRQFTAMETYINQMNAQSAWLAQQFGQ